jgi:aldehyde dehydrogenase (NAD+)
VYGAGPVVREAISLGIEYAWMNSGQTCAAWTRMPVPASRHEEVVELAVAAAEAFSRRSQPTGRSDQLRPVADLWCLPMWLSISGVGKR